MPCWSCAGTPLWWNLLNCFAKPGLPWKGKQWRGEMAIPTKGMAPPWAVMHREQAQRPHVLGPGSRSAGINTDDIPPDGDSSPLPWILGFSQLSVGRNMPGEAD